MTNAMARLSRTVCCVEKSFYNNETEQPKVNYKHRCRRRLQVDILPLLKKGWWWKGGGCASAASRVFKVCDLSTL
jgi:hypothetical protein